MNRPDASVIKNLSGNRFFWIGLAILGFCLFVAASFHLIYVAVQSQPECVAHKSWADNSSQDYRAAKSACSPD